MTWFIICVCVRMWYSLLPCIFRYCPSFYWFSKIIVLWFPTNITQYNVLIAQIKTVISTRIICLFMGSIIDNHDVKSQFRRLVFLSSFSIQESGWRSVDLLISILHCSFHILLLRVQQFHHGCIIWNFIRRINHLIIGSNKWKRDSYLQSSSY